MHIEDRIRGFFNPSKVIIRRTPSYPFCHHSTYAGGKVLTLGEARGYFLADSTAEEQGVSLVVIARAGLLFDYAIDTVEGRTWKSQPRNVYGKLVTPNEVFRLQMSSRDEKIQFREITQRMVDKPEETRIICANPYERFEALEHATRALDNTGSNELPMGLIIGYVFPQPTGRHYHDERKHNPDEGKQ